MSWARIAEGKIREAMREGRFDGIERDGAIDLEEYFKLPVELRLAYSMLKNAGLVPEEVEMLKDVERLQAALDAAPDEASRAPLRQQLAAARLRLDVALERSRAARRSAAE
jgi:hypothetical protein